MTEVKHFLVISVLAILASSNSGVFLAAEEVCSQSLKSLRKSLSTRLPFTERSSAPVNPPVLVHLPPLIPTSSLSVTVTGNQEALEGKVLKGPARETSSLATAHQRFGVHRRDGVSSDVQGRLLCRCSVWSENTGWKCLSKIQ